MADPKGVSIQLLVGSFGSLLGSFFIRVPYYFGDPKGDPNLENYPTRI